MRNFLLIIAASLAVSCSTTRHQVAEQANTDTNIVTRYVERLVTDTLYIELPAQTAANVTLPTDTSRLETDYAASSAWLDTAGLLHHTLNNKTRPRPTTFQRTEVTRDSIITLTKTITRTITKSATIPLRYKLLCVGGLLGAFALGFNLGRKFG